MSVDDPTALRTDHNRPPLILSLSGGGFRGYFTALVLTSLEDLLGAQCNKIFDMIAGTSIGGIIALGLAHGAPARSIAQSISWHGSTIFPALRFRRARRLFGPPYGTAGLCAAIREIIPDSAEIPLSLAGTRVMVAAVSPGSTALVTASSWDRGFTAEMTTVDAALATSAAPTYFPTHRARLGPGGPSMDLVDGGIAANAPDMLAIHHAVASLGFPERRIAMLSVGTCAAVGGAPGSAHPAAFGAIGTLRRLGGRGIIELMMAVQEARGVEEARVRLGGQRHLRIDRPQGSEQSPSLGLDDASDAAKRTLEDLATAAGRELKSHLDLGHHVLSAAYAKARAGAAKP
jgi:hypothetical protein